MRAQLRADGIFVFQLDWESVTDGDDACWPPYHGNGQQNARGVYTRFGGDPADLVGTIWCDPFQTLKAFLADPDPDRWMARAAAAVAGLLPQPGAEFTGLDQRVKPAGGWTALAVIDDRLPVIESDEEAHRRRWRVGHQVLPTIH